MSEIGAPEGPLNLDSVDIKTVSLIKSFQRNKLLLLSASNSYLDISVLNQIKTLSPIPFKKWKVVGLGIYWVVPSTANEDPIVEFGNTAVADDYGKMTAAITGGEKFNILDHQKYDPFNLLASKVIAEASPTLVVTWTPGANFGVWQYKVEILEVCEAAVAAMTTGRLRFYFLVEVDTGGKW